MSVEVTVAVATDRRDDRVV